AAVQLVQRLAQPFIAPVRVERTQALLRAFVRKHAVGIQPSGIDRHIALVPRHQMSDAFRLPHVPGEYFPRGFLVAVNEQVTVRKAAVADYLESDLIQRDKRPFAPEKRERRKQELPPADRPPRSA